MRIRIYQINIGRDEKQTCFMKYETMLKIQGELNSSIYDLIYETDMDTANLERIYTIFNIERPEDYRGRSLSVSDIVEIMHEEDGKTKFYYCDAFGFKEVDFNPDRAVKSPLFNSKKRLEVLVIEPGKHPVVRKIDNGLASLQQIVGGSIQAVYPYEDPIAIICNEDGKLIDLPANRTLKNSDGAPYDIIVGTFLITGIGESDFCSLSEEYQEKYKKMFWYPQVFLQTGSRAIVVNITEEID